VTQSIVLEELGNDGDEDSDMRSVVKVTDNLVGMVERNRLLGEERVRNRRMVRSCRRRSMPMMVMSS
jgi:hypothetical protein